MSSFGIFDGHNGTKAATYCAENLNNEVERRYKDLYDKLVGNNSEISLSDIDVDDCLMCQAIRSSISCIDEKILKDNESGTTSVTLYLKKCPASNSIRMYCANVGDSRAVMFTTVNLNDNTLVQHDSSPATTYDFQDHSSHSIGSDSGNGSNISSSGYSGHSNHYDLSSATVIDDNFVPNNIVLQSSLQHNEFDEPLTIYKGFNESSDKLAMKGLMKPSSLTAPNSVTPPGTPSSSVHDKNNSKYKKRGKPQSNYVVLGHLISEDHKLQLQRERSRIETKGSVTEYLLPADGSIIHSPNAAKGMSLRNYVLHDKAGNIVGSGVNLQESRVNLAISSDCAETISLLSDFSIFESNNYPDSSRLLKAEKLLESITNDVEFEQAISNRTSKTSSLGRDDISEADLESEPAIEILHDDSFIMRRRLVTENGVIMGPEALCGRHNLSIMMTRSIGDKYGPRSCVAVPDICAFTLPSEQHTRFILASDGFWDVVPIESVRVLVMSNKFKDSRELATHLTRKAARRRIKQNIRMDDISVIVVDYNVDKFIAVAGGGKITRKSFNTMAVVVDEDNFMDKCLLGTELCSIS